MKVGEIVEFARETHDRLEPEVPRPFVDQFGELCGHTSLFAVLTELEDRTAELSDGVVEFVDGARDAVGDQCGLRGALHCLEIHAGREDPLNDHVVEVAGDAFAVLEHRHL